MQTSTLYLHATIIWSPIIIELGLYSANIVSYRFPCSLKAYRFPCSANLNLKCWTQSLYMFEGRS